MSKIRVIHLVHDFLFGGIEAFLYYLTQAQAHNEDLDIAVLCCQNKEEVINKRIIESGITIHYVKLDPFDIHVNRYRKIVRITNDYDIVNMHIFKPFLAEALRFSKARIVYTNHSAGVVGRPTSLGYKAKAKLLVRFLNRFTSAITNNSHYTKDFWLKMGVNNKNNTVIYNGVLFTENVDTNRAFSEFPILKEKFVVGTTSRFISWKRIEYLIEAFYKFQNSKSDVILLLVGDGPTKSKLIDYAKELEISHKVIFSGFKTSVIDFQSKMDICVFASNAEPFGLVAVECLHLGKHTVVFKDGGGITEIIEGVEKENVVDDTDQLAKLLNLKYANFKNNVPDQFTQKRIEYSENFNVIKIEQEFYALYNNVINN